LFLSCCCYLFALTQSQAIAPLNVDLKTLSLSGISSGGSMAIQVHVAHSAIFQKMASIAGPPYRCAEGEIGTALSACTIEPMLINLNLMISTTGKYYSQGEIDDPTNLANSSVWLFSGTKDTIVHTGVVKKSLEYYQHYITNSKLIQFINTIPAEHSWVTDNYGNPCGIFKKPFLNNCNYDAAGILLQFFFWIIESSCCCR